MQWDPIINWNCCAWVNLYLIMCTLNKPMVQLVFWNRTLEILAAISPLCNVQPQCMLTPPEAHMLYLQFNVTYELSHKNHDRKSKGYSFRLTRTLTLIEVITDQRTPQLQSGTHVIKYMVWISHWRLTKTIFHVTMLEFWANLNFNCTFSAVSPIVRQLLVAHSNVIFWAKT